CAVVPAAPPEPAERRLVLGAGLLGPSPDRERRPPRADAPRMEEVGTDVRQGHGLLAARPLWPRDRRRPLRRLLLARVRQRGDRAKAARAPTLQPRRDPATGRP